MIALVILSAFVIMSLGVYGTVRSFINDEIEDATRKNAQFLGAFTAGYRLHSSLEDEYFKGYLKSMALMSDTFIFVTELNQNISYASDGENFYPFVRNDVSRAVVDSILTYGEYEGVGDLGGIFMESRYLYGSLYTENVGGVAESVGYVVVSPNTTRVDTIWQGVGILFIILVGVMLVVISFLGSYFAAVQVKPLNDMADVARRFGQGELTARLMGYDHRVDEMGDLAREFNGMASSLAQAEEQRTTFISNVSHELKTPMTTITGFAEGILDGTVTPARREKSLEIIIAETRRLSRLVQQMLELSRMDARKSEPVVQEEFDLIDVLAQVIISMESKILSRNLDIDIQIPEGELMVWGNPDGITQVCYNLLDNATKFAVTGSVITVTVETRERKAYVSVKNLGEALENEELPLLFQRFHKKDDSRSTHRDGLGLGLYIVKSILASLQESITVVSEEGVTEFTFTLSLV